MQILISDYVLDTAYVNLSRYSPNLSQVWQFNLLIHARYTPFWRKCMTLCTHITAFCTLCTTRQQPHSSPGWLDPSTLGELMNIKANILKRWSQVSVQCRGCKMAPKDCFTCLSLLCINTNKHIHVVIGKSVCTSVCCLSAITRLDLATDSF